ncbi:hypothetical protein [Burkholderia stagnalis]|uniref:hypothetical protein n=1 Tax=Burkholderia stagnalis TaxID=1503054 RepID=UPI000F57455D|nr:hypothetical protein [Burkholderia stagnalis]
MLSDTARSTDRQGRPRASAPGGLVASGGAAAAPMLPAATRTNTVDASKRSFRVPADPGVSGHAFMASPNAETVAVADEEPRKLKERRG